MIFNLSQLQVLAKTLNNVASMSFDFFQTLVDLNTFVRLLTNKLHLFEDSKDQVNIVPVHDTINKHGEVNEFS